MANYPAEKPESAVEVTAPIGRFAFDVETGLILVEFGPGEEVKLDIREAPGAGEFLYGFIVQVSMALYDPNKVWARPEIIAAAEARLAARLGDKAPF
jgi:hypothetical protein